MGPLTHHPSSVSCLLMLHKLGSHGFLETIPAVTGRKMGNVHMPWTVSQHITGDTRAHTLKLNGLQST